MEGGPSIQDNETTETINLTSSEDNSGCYFTCCHPSGKMHRFVALIFMCFLGFGKFFF